MIRAVYIECDECDGCDAIILSVSEFLKALPPVLGFYIPPPENTEKYPTLEDIEVAYEGK